MTTRLMAQFALRYTSVAVVGVLALACGGPTTLQVFYSGNVPAGGLTITLTQGGQTTVVSGSSFTTDGFGTPHSIPLELRHTGPVQVVINLTDPGGTLVVEGLSTFDVGVETVYQMSLYFTRTRPVCAHGCAPKASFPSLVSTSSDTLFVYLASPPPTGVIGHRAGDELRLARNPGPTIVTVVTPRPFSPISVH